MRLIAGHWLTTQAQRAAWAGLPQVGRGHRPAHPRPLSCGPCRRAVGAGAAGGGVRRVAGDCEGSAEREGSGACDAGRPGDVCAAGVPALGTGVRVPPHLPALAPRTLINIVSSPPLHYISHQCYLPSLSVVIILFNHSPATILAVPRTCGMYCQPMRPPPLQP